MDSRESAAHAASPSARALRVMAGVRWLLLAAVAGLAATTWWALVLRGDAPTTGEPRYYCPMHPQITSHDPGSCPICFMQLEPIPDANVAHPAEHGSHEELPEPVEPEVGSAPEGTSAVMLTTERRQASGISVAPATRSEVASEVRWPASIEAIEGARAEVRVRAEAFIERVVVRESGVAVRRGQVLAFVSSPEILRAEEELLTAHRWSGEAAGPQVAPAVARRLELLGVSASDVQAILRAGVARTRVPIRAPIAGIVTRVEAFLGVAVSPEEALYEITSFERVRVVATVLSPAELALAATSPARLVLRGRALEVPLVLELVEPTLEASSRGARARFLADNAEGTLRPGDIGEVVVEAPRASAVLVPRDAVVDRGRARYVFVETEAGLFEPRIVETGALRDEQREIVRGLAPGERVVVRGGFVLDSESRLSAALAPRDAPAAEPPPPPQSTPPAEEP